MSDLVMPKPGLERYLIVRRAFYNKTGPVFSQTGHCARVIYTVYLRTLGIPVESVSDYQTQALLFTIIC